MRSPVDNCPAVANPDQADSDRDGRGDACDACPSPNADDSGCAATIYDLKKPINGTRALVGSTVSIASAVVTATSAKNFFMQVPDAERSALGADYSGVYVYSSTKTTLPKVGDHILLKSAKVQEYFGQIQLADADWALAPTTVPAPQPILVTSLEVKTGGSRADTLESVLVKLTEVSVTQVDPPIGSGDTAPSNEFVISSVGDTGGVRVNDYFYKPATAPTVGTAFPRVRGVLELRNENSKVEPRDATDLQGPPALASFGEASGQFIRVRSDCGTGGCSLIGAKLYVVLARADNEDIEVTVTSTDATSLGVANGGKVIVPAGATRAEVKLLPLAQALAVKLNASANGSTQATTVRVLAADEQPAPSKLTPNPLVTALGLSSTVTVTLDLPAPPGTSVEFSVEPAELGTFEPSATVPVTADATTASVTFKASSTLVASSGTLKARLGTSEVTAEVRISGDFPEVQSVTPATATVIQGTTREFTVTLSKPAEGDLQVNLTAAATGSSGGTFGTVPASVHVAAGQQSATFLFTADAAGNNTGEVKATLAASTAKASVTVRAPYPKLLSITPAVTQVSPNGTKTFNVTLDKNAEAGGYTVALVLEPAGLGTLSATSATIPEGAKTLATPVTFTAGAAEGSGKLTVSNAEAGSTISANISVATPQKVLISEIAVAGATASDEFVELYNPNTTEVDISGWKLQYKSATGTSGYNNTFVLPGDSKIAPHGFFLVTSPTYVGSSGGDANWGTVIAGLAAGGGHIRIGLPDMTTATADPLAIDTLGYGTANAPEGTAISVTGIKTNGSIERKAYASSSVASMAAGGADESKGNGYDSENNSADFLLRETRNPQNKASPAELP